MTALSTTVFSEYEVSKMYFIFSGGDTGVCECLSKLEEEMEVNTVAKYCGKTRTKSRTYGTGNGTLKVIAHMPLEVYYRLHAMGSGNLSSGVKGYGYTGGMHPEVCVTADVFDEDGVEKYKAWPCAVISAGPKHTVENGAETVAECELEIAVSPDSYGFGMYEALKSSLTTAQKNSWLTAFSGALVTATALAVSETAKTVTKGGNATVTVSNATGTPTIYVKQAGTGVTATLGGTTLTIAASSSATVGTAWVELVDTDGDTASIVVTVVAS